MAVQEMRENGFGLGSGVVGRGGAGLRRRSSRGFAEDFSEKEEGRAEPESGKTRRAGFGSGFGSGVRLRFRAGFVPESRWGRIVGGVAVLAIVGGAAFVAESGRRALVRDERFVIPSSASIQIEGNRHLSRAQLLSVFGQDVERNVLTISLADRRGALEQLPWVEHATVMRLLPNKLRVAVVERTPVAFVRQGRHIGLVDAHGVLLDLGENQEKYSFPVVTGINADEPLSVRAARMKIYLRFASELDGSGESISSKLSEVDLSNPEDVKALIPDHSTDVLVHFGDTDFLERYRKFQEQVEGWRAQYPKLASADMRYERQVVLEMQAGAAVPTGAEPAKTDARAIKKPVVAVKGTVQAYSVHTAKAPVKTTVAHGLSSKALSEMGQPHYPAGVGKQ